MCFKRKEPETIVKVETQIKYVPEGTQEIFIYYLGISMYSHGISYMKDCGVTESAEKAAAWTKAHSSYVAEYKAAYKLADGTYLARLPEYKVLKVAG